MKAVTLISLVSLTAVNAFTVGSVPSSSCTVSSSSSSSSSLNLVPEQGKQLAAAWEAAATHLHDDAALVMKQRATDKPKKFVTPNNAARAFVARVFSLPSTLLHPKEDLTHHNKKNKQEVVYYPIVGFTYVAGSTRPIPPCATSSSCLIPSNKEPVYGWWSQACRLSHPDSDDYGMPPSMN